MSVFKAIDTFLLDDTYQLLTNWLTRVFSTTNFMISMVCYGLWLVLDITEQAVDESGFTLGDGAWAAFFAALVALQCFVTYPQHKAAMQPRSTATANPLRKELFLLRMLFILLLLPVALLAFLARASDPDQIGRWLDIAQSLVLVSGLYFVSCTTVPPKPRESWDAQPTTQ